MQSPGSRTKKKSPVFIPYLSEQDLKCSFRPCLVTLEDGKHLYSILGIETKVWGFLISSVSCSMSQGQGAQTRRPKTGIPNHVPWVILSNSHVLSHGNRLMWVHEYLGLFYFFGTKFHTQNWHCQSYQMFLFKNNGVVGDKLLNIYSHHVR